MIGFDAELLPKVDNHLRDGESPQSVEDGEGPTAYAIGAVAEWNALRWLAVGIAPRYIIGLSPAMDNTTSTQLDLRARIAIGGNVTRTLRLYAFAEPGYSLVLTSQNQEETSVIR